MKGIKLYLIISAAFVLVGCSYAKKLDHSDEYKTAAPSIKPIDVPQNLKVQNGEAYYPIPAINSVYSKANVSIIPPGSALNNQKK